MQDKIQMTTNPVQLMTPKH